jgi:hypothetical protein
MGVSVRRRGINARECPFECATAAGKTFAWMRRGYIS